MSFPDNYQGDPLQSVLSPLQDSGVQSMADVPEPTRVDMMVDLAAEYQQLKKRDSGEREYLEGRILRRAIHAERQLADLRSIIAEKDAALVESVEAMVNAAKWIHLNLALNSPLFSLLRRCQELLCECVCMPPNFPDFHCAECDEVRAMLAIKEEETP